MLVAYAGLPSLVVTIGTLALYRGIAQIILKERGVSGFPDWYQDLGFGTIGAHADPLERRSSSCCCSSAFAVYPARHAAGAGPFTRSATTARRPASPASTSTARMLGVFAASGAMCALAAIVLTAYLASARSDTAIGLELPVITAVVLGGVNIFGGSGTLGGVLIALLVLAFVQNALGLAGVTPEEQQIVTGAVLILTLAVFGAAGRFRQRLDDALAPASAQAGGAPTAQSRLAARR